MFSVVAVSAPSNWIVPTVFVSVTVPADTAAVNCTPALLVMVRVPGMLLADPVNAWPGAMNVRFCMATSIVKACGAPTAPVRRKVRSTSDASPAVIDRSSRTVMSVRGFGVPIVPPDMPRESTPMLVVRVSVSPVMVRRVSHSASPTSRVGDRGAPALIVAVSKRAPTAPG